MESSTVELTTTPRINRTSSITSTATRIVRVNWLKFLFYSWKRISVLSKVIVSFSVLLVILQVATAIVILIISNRVSCDQPLRTFIIVYMVRIILSCPFHVGEHFQRAEQRLAVQQRRQRDQARQEQLRRRRRARQASTNTAESASLEQQPVVVQPRSNWLTLWGERIKSVLDLFAILWFIVGNYLLFTSRTCRTEAPELYYTTLAYTLMGYCIVIFPLLLCTSVVLCLPWVLIIMRELNITQVNGMEEGGRKEEISQIPIFRFKASSSDHSYTATTTATDIPTEQIKIEKPSQGVMSKLLRSYRKGPIEDIETATLETICITPTEDAVCCICLSDYEEDDLVCKLWCHHHFHKSCITEWLTLNRKCPLCKQDFRGKEYDEADDDEDDPVEDELDVIVRNAHNNQSSSSNAV